MLRVTSRRVRHACARESRIPLRVVAVLGAHAGLAPGELAGLPVRIAINADWSLGIENSVRAAVSAERTRREDADRRRRRSGAGRAIPEGACDVDTRADYAQFVQG